MKKIKAQKALQRVKQKIQKKSLSQHEATKQRERITLDRTEIYLYDALEPVWNNQNITSFKEDILSVLIPTCTRIAREQARLVVADIFYDEDTGLTQAQWLQLVYAYIDDYLPALIEVEVDLMIETNQEYIKEKEQDRVFSDSRRITIATSINTDTVTFGRWAMVPVWNLTLEYAYGLGSGEYSIGEI